MEYGKCTRGVATVGETRDSQLYLRSSISGLLHESYVHECLKSSLAFRKPAVAVVSRRPARTEGL